MLPPMRFTAEGLSNRASATKALEDGRPDVAPCYRHGARTWSLVDVAAE